MYIDHDEDGKSSISSVSRLKTPLEKRLEERARLAAQAAEEGARKARSLLTKTQLMILSSLPNHFMAAKENDVTLACANDNVNRLLHFEFAAINDGYIFRTQKGNSMLSVNDMAPLFSKENLKAWIQGDSYDSKNKNNKVYEMSDIEQFNAFDALWRSLCDLSDADDALCKMSKLFSPVRLFAARVKGRDTIVAECEVLADHVDDPFVVILLNPKASTPKAAMARYLETRMKFEHRLMVRLLSPRDASMECASVSDAKVAHHAVQVNEKGDDVNNDPGVSGELTQENQAQPKGNIILSMDETSEDLLHAMHAAIRSLTRLAEMIEKNQRTQK